MVNKKNVHFKVSLFFLLLPNRIDELVSYLTLLTILMLTIISSVSLNAKRKYIGFTFISSVTGKAIPE